MMPSIFFAMDDETKRDHASVKVSTDVVNSDSVNYDFLGLDYNDLIRCSDAEFDEIINDKSTMMSADHNFPGYTSRGDFQDYIRRQMAYQEEEATKCLVEEEVSCGCTTYKYKNCMHLLELVNHDCMWTGLCVNRDHRDSSSLLSRKSESRFVPSKVSPGKSVLIPKQQTMTTTTPVNVPFAADSLSSDGDSLRPDTPLSSDSDGEHDSFQGSIFKHDELCFDSLLECKSVPMSEVLSPKYFMSYSRAKWVNDKKRFEEKQQFEEIEKAQSQSISESFDSFESPESMESDSSDDGRLETETAQTTCLVISKSEQNWKTTLSDHCYHINKPEETSLTMDRKKMDSLGVQTPSDSEEEIDVVSFDKPTRATATLPTYPQSSQQQQYQRMMDTALRQKTKAQNQSAPAPAQPPRQRGRPKGSTARKRNAQAAEMGSVHVNKRTKTTRPYNRKTSVRVTETHDSESDTERRSTHNNMERTRRSQLKSHFEFLRRQVPAIENNEKAAKVEILRQSRNYILALEAAFKEGEEQCNMLRARQARLKNRLSVSRRELAAKGWNTGHE